MIKKKDLLDLKDFDRKEIEHILKLASKLKCGRVRSQPLKKKSIGMIFTKSSTRTRVSFEAGIFQLGGNPIFLSGNDLQLGRGETIEDTARVLDRYLDGIVIRTHKHEDIVRMAANTNVPVINGLTDRSHPCQALADVFTMQEKKRLSEIKVAYIGDGNNVAQSLAVICSKLGIDLSIATPPGYDCSSEFMEYTNDSVKYSNDPKSAVSEADFIYTDVWTSMGQEGEEEARKKTFKDFQVNADLVKYAKKDFYFMHCLPAHREEEVTHEIIEGNQSIVFDQAENRLHAQKAILMEFV